MNRLLICASALTLLFASQAQAAESQTITINGDVQQACVLGAPTSSTVSLGDLTGPDGKLTAALTNSTSASPSAQTQIADAWCNAPSKLTISATALTQAVPPSYSTPAGFSRNITYNAEATGWPTSAIYRPAVTGSPAQSTAAGALLSPINIKVWDLETLNSTGTAQSPGLVVEAGSYSGTIQLTLAVN